MGWKRHHGDCRSGCQCDGPIHFRPRFATKAQEIARLKEYLEDLRNEAKAVEEHIKELSKKK
jgi:hypothetical protein